jgi:crotonobetainyl-CoA:carnitine CoA-transferase CaiB-like acyl-CoA transferase
VRDLLRDFRVTELATGIAGGYAGKLFADAGADVVKVEPEGGDPLRASRLFEFLNGSKRSIVGSLGSDSVVALIGGADIVIESFEPGLIEAAGLLDDPSLVVLSLTPWGRGGPLTGRPWTEFIVQAECGSLAGRGHPTRPPVQAGGRIAEFAAGIYGAPAALAAARHARVTGRGAHIDVSMIEAMCVCTNLFTDTLFSLLGRPPLGGTPQTVETPSIHPTADGWVGFNTNAAQMFDDFLLLIGRPDLIEGREWSNMAARWARLDEWNAMVEAYTSAHTTAEVIAAATELRVPVAPVNDGRSVLADEQFVARQVFTSHGSFVAPTPPYKLAGERPPAPTAAPGLGEHTGRVEARTRPAAAIRRGSSDEAPFAGVRVLDLTCWWAGPSATQFFAALGADVIHVESIQRVDGMRFAAAVAFMGRERWWEYSSFFLSINPNKRDVTLDLADPEALELVKRMVEWADLVVENYTPRVMERFGLDWPAVHALNPRAVMARMPAFGLDGPWRDRPGFAQNMEQMSGLAWVTGYPDDPPLIPRGPCDPLGGMHAAFAIQLALAQRDADGAGVLVEVPLIESALNLAAEQVIEFTATGTVLQREGNRTRGVAPQGVYACRPSADGLPWIAISIATDDQWASLRKAIGDPDWAAEPRFDNYDGRWAGHDELDRLLAAWAASSERDEAVSRLVSHGVPAASLFDSRAVSAHPHLQARGFFETVDHPVVGTHQIMTLPFRWSGVEHWLHTPAPTLGQHNADVLSSLLGLSPGTIAGLADRHIIGETPLGV